MNILLYSAITPSILILYIIYNKDTVKEPAGLLAKCFFLGVLSAIPAIALSSFFQLIQPAGTILFSSLYDAFVIASFSEELAKFAMLFLLVWRSKYFDQFYDGIVYAIFVSLGFATLENILYVMDGGLGVALGRAVLAVPGHAFFGVAMGYFLALAKFSAGNERTKYLALSFVVPVMLHGIYDFLLMYSSAGADVLPDGVLIGLLVVFSLFVILMWRFGFRRIKKHLHKDKSTLS